MIYNNLRVEIMSPNSKINLNRSIIGLKNEAVLLSHFVRTYFFSSSFIEI